ILRRADLAHDRDVERRVERPRDLGGDGHAAAGDADHHRRLCPVGLQQSSESPAGVVAIAEAARPRRRPRWVLEGRHRAKGAPAGLLAYVTPRTSYPLRRDGPMLRRVAKPPGVVTVVIRRLPRSPGGLPPWLPGRERGRLVACP